MLYYCFAYYQPYLISISTLSARLFIIANAHCSGHSQYTEVRICFTRLKAVDLNFVVSLYLTCYYVLGSGKPGGHKLLVPVIWIAGQPPK